jgi:hypothetical protein
MFAKPIKDTVRRVLKYNIFPGILLTHTDNSIITFEQMTAYISPEDGL